MSHDVWVYADWEEFTEPVLVGILSSDLIGISRSEQLLMAPAFNV